MQGTSTVLQQSQTFDATHVYAAYFCMLVHVLSNRPNVVEGAHNG